MEHNASISVVAASLLIVLIAAAHAYRFQTRMMLERRAAEDKLRPEM